MTGMIRAVWSALPLRFEAEPGRVAVALRSRRAGCLQRCLAGVTVCLALRGLRDSGCSVART